MKPLLKIYIIVTIILSLPFSNQILAQEYAGTVLIKNVELVKQDDSVHVNFKVYVNADAVPDLGMILLKPALNNGEKLLTLPVIQLNGQERFKLNRRSAILHRGKFLSNYQKPLYEVNVNRGNKESLAYAFTFPYEPWMEEAHLFLKQEQSCCGGVSRLYTYVLQDKMNIPYNSYEIQPEVCLTVPDDVIKTRSQQGQSMLDFPVGKSHILPDFRRNPDELARITNAFAGIIHDKDITLKSITLEGFTSPEGSYTSNNKLAHDRVYALKDYLQELYAFPESIFTIHWIGEDWAGLQQLVSQSSMPYKQEILEIVDSKDDFDKRESRLRQLAGGIPYGKLLREIFPDLRRVEYRIDYQIRNYTLDEIKNLLNSHPENLSQTEMYRVALDYGKGTPEYNHILMDIIPFHFPADSIALGNASAALIEQKEYHTARRILENTSETPAILNNLGVAYLYLEDFEKANQYLSRAAMTGLKESEHNLEELRKKLESVK